MDSQSLTIPGICFWIFPLGEVDQVLMKAFIAYMVAIALSLFNGKLVAGAISGILITPLVKPVEWATWVPRYLVPFVQGIAMGFVAVLTAKWVLKFFGLALGWGMVGLILVGFVVITSQLLKKVEERHFHLCAGLGELLGISLVSYYLLEMAK